MPERGWTDDDLRHALPGARTWSDVCRSLGLAPGGDARERVRRRAEELALPHEHLVPGPGGSARRTWSDQDLAMAVARAGTLHEVFALLGLVVGGSSWTTMQQHILRLELDTSHWKNGPVLPVEHRGAPLTPPWTDGQVREAFEGARSVAQILRLFGLDPSRKRGRRALERRLDDLGLDHRALPGRRWAKGTTRAPRGRPLHEILVEDSDYRSIHTLKKRLIAEGLLVPVCAICGIREWLGRPLNLHLDHINGVRTDHRLDNLRLLCPNCHSQTPTYCGRNVRAR